MATNMRRTKIHKFTSTGAGNIAFTVSPGYTFRLVGSELHLSAAGAANSMTITRDSGDGAAYDTLVYTVDLSAITDDIKTWDNLYFDSGDSLVVAWTNGSSRTYGLTIRVEELY